MTLSPQLIEKLKCIVWRFPFVIATVARHGIIDVHNGGYEAKLTDVSFGSLMGIPSPVNALMMRQCRLQKHIGEAGGVGQYLCSTQDMLPHDFELICLIAPRLVQYLDRDLRFTDIMQQHAGS